MWRQLWKACRCLDRAAESTELFNICLQLIIAGSNFRADLVDSQEVHLRRAGLWPRPRPRDARVQQLELTTSLSSSLLALACLCSC